MTVTLVAAVARNGVIGAEGGIPWHLPGEQRLFRELTLGHVLVMGRKTYESIGRPLPERTTIVVTRQDDWEGAEGVVTAASVSEAIAHARTIDEEVFVVGGARVYAEALPVADRLALTWVDAEPEGDVRFPAVDWDDWDEVARQEHEGWDFASYERRVASSP